ncbi:sulfotransferase family 2 domain-containing protein [Tropicibacter alexandrii]|uniref:sulfotransferase family 2 domain-containing protein n=1 Tax=Tropicibacter alexandrii TaxID=2267683 RepID=UPI001F0CB5BF|nr:sulfotransferase family 2 domain-containing protein [Tropicibacter alexandrii]
MPILRINDKCVFFAHVPKCGGTSMTRYLEARFGEMGLLDRGFRKAPAQGWTRSSPQHVPFRVLETLLGPGFFALSFTVVRHPATRFLSAYEHQATIGGIPQRMRPEKLLAALPGWSDKQHFATDNHFRPAVEIAPAQAVFFRLEEGFDAMSAWLDGLEGQSHPDLAVQHENSRKKVQKKQPTLNRLLHGKVTRPKLTPELAERIHAVYAPDYARFGYDVMPPHG